jgi:hypothetical protein
MLLLLLTFLPDLVGRMQYVSAGTDGLQLQLLRGDQVLGVSGPGGQVVEPCGTAIPGGPGEPGVG